MPGLRELQQQFAANLFDAESSAVLDDIGGGVFPPSQRIQVYRNNVFTAFTEALRAVYPVIEKLVGEGFFLYASNEFISRSPSVSGDLHDYGREFPSFLKEFEPAKGLLYLHDVALMEWYYHEVYHAADTAVLDLAALSQVASERHEFLRFKLNPASRIMQSRFPVIDIWRVNQDGFDGDQAVDLDSGAVNVLLLRRGEEVELHPIETASFEALSRLSQRQPLGECLNAVLRIDPDFDLNKFLVLFTGNGTLVAFEDAGN